MWSDVIARKDLNVDGMLKNHHLARAGREFGEDPLTRFRATTGLLRDKLGERPLVESPRVLCVESPRVLCVDDRPTALRSGNEMNQGYGTRFGQL